MDATFRYLYKLECGDTEYDLFCVLLASDPSVMQTINDAFDDYIKNTCIRFKKRTSETAYVSFFKGSG